MNADQRRRMREAFQSPETLLHACVRDNDIARLRQLLPRCRAQDVNYLDSSWGSPLHVAVWCDGSAAVPLLLRAGADPLAPGWGDGPSSPIMLAIRQGKCRMLERLWTNVAPETHANGTTGCPYASCIAQAATFGQVCAMEHLLSWWDAWSQDAKDCALTAAAGRWHFYVVDVLLTQFTYSSEILLQSLQKVSSFPFYAPGELRKPEYTAADYLHQQQIIKRLIDAGADPTNEAHATGTPLILHTAQSIDLSGALKVLLEQGCNPSGISSHGESALHLLASPIRARQNMPGSLQHHELGTRLLLSHGASVYLKDASGNTALHRAAFAASLRIFRHYVSGLTPHEGVDARTDLMQMVNNHGETLLHWVAAGGKVGILEYLLSLRPGAEHVNKPTDIGWTPLMCALAPTTAAPAKRSQESVHVARLLLSHGADPHCSTAEGWTPLHCLALHMDNDPVGEVALLAVDLIDQGSGLEVRALLQDQEQRVPREYVMRDLMKKASSASGAVKSHWTPLQLAAERGAVGMVKTLLEHGADPSSEDEHGKRATELAVESTRLDEFPEARDAVLQLLLECYDKQRQS